MPLDVICPAWGRTGTASMQAALQELGLPCHHMFVVVKSPGQEEFWLQAADDVAQGKPVDFEPVLSSMKAVADWPCAYFWKQLLLAYPQAKVVLVTRDADKWYESANETIYALYQMISEAPWYVLKVLSWLKGIDFPRHVALIRLVWEGDLQGCFGSDPDRAQQLYLEHVEQVKQAVPRQRLLVFNLSQGWEPLCKFLGKPVPNKPFPHVNDRQEWVKFLASLRCINNTAQYGVPVAVAIAAIAAAAVLRRRLQ